MIRSIQQSIARKLTRMPIVGKYGVAASAAAIALVLGTSAYAASAAVNHYETKPIKTVASPNSPAPSSPQSKTSKDNSGLSNGNHYKNTAGNVVHSPAYSTDGGVPSGATGLCNDGAYTFSQSKEGSCSSHGGVNTWIGISPTSANSAPSTTPPLAAPTCNQDLRSSYTDSYNADVNAENITHNNNLQSISDSWNSRGSLYSGGYQSDVNAENQRHQTALTSLSNTHNQDLASINCS